MGMVLLLVMIGYVISFGNELSVLLPNCKLKTVAMVNTTRTLNAIFLFLVENTPQISLISISYRPETGIYVIYHFTS